VGDGPGDDLGGRSGPGTPPVKSPSTAPEPLQRCPPMPELSTAPARRPPRRSRLPRPSTPATNPPTRPPAMPDERAAPFASAIPDPLAAGRVTCGARPELSAPSRPAPPCWVSVAPAARAGCSAGRRPRRYRVVWAVVAADDGGCGGCPTGRLTSAGSIVAPIATKGVSSPVFILAAPFSADWRLLARPRVTTRTGSRLARRGFLRRRGRRRPKHACASTPAGPARPTGPSITGHGPDGQGSAGRNRRGRPGRDAPALQTAPLYTEGANRRQSAPLPRTQYISTGRAAATTAVVAATTAHTTR